VIHWYNFSRLGDKGNRYFMVQSTRDQRGQGGLIFANSFDRVNWRDRYLDVNQQSRVWLLLVMLWIINGSSFLAIKVAIDTIPPLLSGGLRFAISGAFLFAVYYFQSERKNHLYQAEINTEAQLQQHQNRHQQNSQTADAFAPSSRALSVTVPPREKISIQQWKDSLILGTSLFLGGQGLLTWGTQYLSSGMTGLLNSTIPLWIAIIALLLYRKTKKEEGGKGTGMTRSKIFGLAAGFGGLMLLVAPSIGTGALSPLGTAALILSSISWAFGSLYSARAKLPVSIFASSGMVMITGGLMLIAVSFAVGEYHNLDLFQISGESMIAQMYLIAIITIIGFTDFYWLLRTTSASLANTFAYVSPVIAVLLGGAILHEEITAITVVAMIIILVGVALMVTKTGKKPRAITSYDTKIPSKEDSLSFMKSKSRKALSQLSHRLRKI
jgi:drug/metabolite transporter (DMT)-like permease